MFNQVENEALDTWFQRLNAPLKRLPAEERANLHLEVRQHLDALVAANEELGSSPEKAWELALTQFGDPRVIGERLFQECQESRSGSRLGWSAIGFGIVLHLAWIMMNVLPLHFWGMSHGITPINSLLAYGSGTLMSFAVGRKYPFHAIKGAFYAFLFWQLVFLSPLILNHATATHGNPSAYVIVPLDIVVSMISFGLTGVLINCGSAYFASVTRRGWYRPSLADFKLTLPRRRAQISQ